MSKSYGDAKPLGLSAAVMVLWHWKHQQSLLSKSLTVSCQQPSQPPSPVLGHGLLSVWQAALLYTQLIPSLPCKYPSTLSSPLALWIPPSVIIQPRPSRISDENRFSSSAPASTGHFSLRKQKLLNMHVNRSLEVQSRVISSVGLPTQVIFPYPP